MRSDWWNLATRQEKVRQPRGVGNLAVAFLRVLGVSAVHLNYPWKTLSAGTESLRNSLRQLR